MESNDCNDSLIDSEWSLVKVKVLGSGNGGGQLLETAYHYCGECPEFLEAAPPVSVREGPCHQHSGFVSFVVCGSVGQFRIEHFCFFGLEWEEGSCCPLCHCSTFLFWWLFCC